MVSSKLLLSRTERSGGGGKTTRSVLLRNRSHHFHKPMNKAFCISLERRSFQPIQKSRDFFVADRPGRNISRKAGAYDALLAPRRWRFRNVPILRCSAGTLLATLKKSQTKLHPIGFVHLIHGGLAAFLAFILEVGDGPFERSSPTYSKAQGHHAASLEWGHTVGALNLFEGFS